MYSGNAGSYLEISEIKFASRVKSTSLLTVRSGHFRLLATLQVLTGGKTGNTGTHKQGFCPGGSGPLGRGQLGP